MIRKREAEIAVAEISVQVARYFGSKAKCYYEIYFSNYYERYTG